MDNFNHSSLNHFSNPDNQDMNLEPQNHLSPPLDPLDIHQDNMSPLEQNGSNANNTPEENNISNENSE